MLYGLNIEGTHVCDYVANNIIPMILNWQGELLKIKSRHALIFHFCNTMHNTCVEYIKFSSKVTRYIHVLKTKIYYVYLQKLLLVVFY